MVKEFEIVLNTTFGGFSIDKEMREWLTLNKGWIFGEYEQEDEDLRGYWGRCKQERVDKIELRTNPDLIACVKALREKNKDIPRKDRYSHSVLSLEVKTVTINVEIDDYDGMETVSIWGMTSD